MLLADGRSNTFFSLNGDPLIRAPESSDTIIEKNLQERSEKRRAKARINRPRCLGSPVLPRSFEQGKPTTNMRGPLGQEPWPKCRCSWK